MKILTPRSAPPNKTTTSRKAGDIVRSPFSFVCHVVNSPPPLLAGINTIDTNDIRFEATDGFEDVPAALGMFSR